MARYVDTCPRCGKRYDNYFPEFHKRFCSIYCEWFDDTTALECRHGYIDVLCVICEGDEREPT